MNRGVAVPTRADHALPVADEWDADRFRDADRVRHEAVQRFRRRSAGHLVVPPSVRLDYALDDARVEEVLRAISTEPDVLAAYRARCAALADHGQRLLDALRPIAEASGQSVGEVVQEFARRAHEAAAAAGLDAPTPEEDR